MITVVGSANMDLIASVPHLPGPGETVLGTHLLEAAGGKGANQAVAAALAGSDVALVGRVGQDGAGTALLDALHRNGVSTRHVSVDTESHTGLALIAVDASGENSIVVASEANMHVMPSDVDAASETLAGSHALIMQLEIPLETVTHAARLAHSQGVRVILNAAPARELQRDLLALVDILVVNEEELAVLTGVGRSVEPGTAAALVRDLGVRTVVVTLGDRGALIAGEDLSVDVPPFAVDVVDTTGAGDTFTGNLASALERGDDLESAARFASAAAALSVSRQGAQPSMPHREDSEQLLRSAQP